MQLDLPSLEAVSLEELMSLALGTSTDDTSRLSRLRDAVSELSTIQRRATTTGERQSAEWVAGALETICVQDVKFVPYAAHSTWAVGFGAHMALALLASLLRGGIGRVAALATLVSFEADATGRSFWLRKLLPGKGRGTNVEGRLPVTGSRRKTLVLVAHHDAAHSGLIWHPLMLEAARRRAAKTGMTPSYTTAPLAAMAMLAAGPSAGQRVARAVLGVSVAMCAQAAMSRTVPGANDNATGVAGMLEIARRLRAEPVPGLEVIVLAPGGQEAGGVGIAGWLDERRSHLDPATTLFVGLDAIGSGEPVVSARDGATGRYRAEDLDLVDRAARRARLTPPRRVGMGNVTDPLIVRHRGFASISLLSWRNGRIPHLHRADDTADNVDWSSVERVIDIAHAVIDEWARS